MLTGLLASDVLSTFPKPTSPFTKSILPLPSKLCPSTVLMFVPETSVSCLLEAKPLYKLFAALSPVFVPLVLPITVSCASLT